MKRPLRYTINTFFAGHFVVVMVFASTSQEEMKKMWFITLLISCGCAVSRAQYPGQIIERGFSDQYKSENTLGEYTFGYNEDHTSGGSFRRETSDRLGNKVGSYGLRVGDGRVRIVNYVADHNGFRADVISNEPGLESQDSNQHSQITKKNIYTVLVPGFKYSSIAPYVTFHSNQQAGSPYGGLIDDVQQYDADDDNFDGEDLRNDYMGEDVRNENPANVFHNEDEAFGPLYSEDARSMYMNQGQVLDDSYLAGEYSHDLETVLQNQTASTENAGETPVYENQNGDFASTTAPSNLKDESLGNLPMNSENKYYPDRASEDLYPFQSSVVLSKTKEHVASMEEKNTTTSESDYSDIATTTASSTTVIA